jgi:hypothetical protein
LSSDCALLGILLTEPTPKVGTEACAQSNSRVSDKIVGHNVQKAAANPEYRLNVPPSFADGSLTGPSRVEFHSQF